MVRKDVLITFESGEIPPTQYKSTRFVRGLYNDFGTTCAASRHSNNAIAVHCSMRQLLINLIGALVEDVCQRYKLPTAEYGLLSFILILSFFALFVTSHHPLYSLLRS